MLLGIILQREFDCKNQIVEYMWWLWWYSFTRGKEAVWEYQATKHGAACEMAIPVNSAGIEAD